MGSEQPIVRPDEPVRHRITVEEFLALDEAGFFNDRHVELIEGEIFEMSPVHLGHGRTAMLLSTALDLAVMALGSDLEALTPTSAHLDEINLPEADILVAASAGADGFVTRGMVRILVEVSASSLRHDLGRKARMYARTGVPEYWVADVNGRKIIRMHAPEGEAYRERATFSFGDPVPSATIPGLIVDTSRLA